MRHLFQVVLALLAGCAFANAQTLQLAHPYFRPAVSPWQSFFSLVGEPSRPSLSPDGSGADNEFARGARIVVIPRISSRTSPNECSLRGTLEVRPTGSRTAIELRVANPLCETPSVILPDNVPLGPAEAYFTSEFDEVSGPARLRIVPMRFTGAVQGSSLLRPFTAGQPVVIRGTGFGRASSTDSALGIEIGGIRAQITAARNVETGFDEVTAIVPQGTTYGCHVPLRIFRGSTVLQVLTVPIAERSGSPCQHALNLTQGQLERLERGSTHLPSAELLIQSEYRIYTPSMDASHNSSVMLNFSPPAVWVSPILPVPRSTDRFTQPQWTTEQLMGCEISHPQPADFFPVASRFTFPPDAGNLVELKRGTDRINLLLFSNYASSTSTDLTGSWQVTGRGGTAVGPIDFEFEIPPALKLTPESFKLTYSRDKDPVVEWNGASYSAQDLLYLHFRERFAIVSCFTRARLGRISIPLAQIAQETGVELPVDLFFDAQLTVFRSPADSTRFSFSTARDGAGVGLVTYRASTITQLEVKRQ